MSLKFSFIIGFSIMLLSACSTPTTQYKTYDLGASTSHIENKAQAKPVLQFNLADINVAMSLETDAMLYRLMYNNEQELRPYAQNRWSMPPAQLLSQHLKTHFTQHGHVVANVSDGITHLPTLKIELIEFAQHFSQINQSTAQLQMRASLIKDRKIIAQKNFTAASASSSPDASGGAKAMSATAELALVDLSAWMHEQIK